MNKKHLKLIGALTSKPYAFTARSWELKSIETIDLFDSLCSNIRIDIRGSEIMRVLPVNNEVINEEWISDKTRFAYDSLKRWRFINPMIKKNEIFIQTSWKEAFSFIKDKVDNETFENFVINTGNYTALEEIVTLEKFSNKFNNVIINSDSNQTFDFQDNYVSLDSFSNIQGKKVLILVGLNSKLENPVFNIKLRKLSQSNDVLIGYIGSNYDYNLNLIHLGNNVEILKKIVEGKHPFNVLIQSFLKKNNKGVKILNKFKNKISLLIGDEFNNNTENVRLLNNIKELNNKFEIQILNRMVGKLNALELGFFNNKKYNLNGAGKNLFYLIGTENVKNFKKADFIIYQGHHNDAIRTNFDVILPSTAWTEKSNLYLNCFGILQKTNLINLPPVQARNDWKITRMLSILFNQDVNFSSINEIHNRLNELSPNLTNSLFNYKAERTLNLKFKTNPALRIKNFVQANPFKTHMDSYFCSNSTERASKVMVECQKTLGKKNNF